MQVRTRWAPSPTGYAHLGFISRVLINYALAKKNGGQFIWRNEDTDTERTIPGAMAFNMKWTKEFGLDWDEGPDDEDLPEDLRKGGPYAPYTQTKRTKAGVYDQAIQTLLDNGSAYRCFCTKERLAELRETQERARQQTRYDGRCRNLSTEEIKQNLDNKVPFTVRIKIPKDRKIEFDDLITHNHVVWDSNEVDDAIIVKSNGVPTYHLAAMYDDVVMKVTHALRGSEWLASTPIHKILFEGLGIKPEDQAQIGHFTVILDPNTPGKKMSKRNDSFRVNALLQRGYLKEAILNYLMLLGWAPKDNRELFTLEEFVEAFDLNGMQKSNPTWDDKKMDWFNGVYLRKFSLDQFSERFYEWVEKYLLTMLPEEEEAFRKKFESLPIDSLLEFARRLLADKPARFSEQLALVQERAVNLWDVLQQIQFFYDAPQNINWDIKQLDKVREQLSEVRAKVTGFMSSLPEDSKVWTHEAWESGMRAIGDALGVKHGDVFMVLRVAVCGTPFSPPLFESLQILGKEEVLARLNAN